MNERRNLLFDCYGSELARGDARALEAALEHVARSAGLTVLGRASHDFEPQGATALLLLSESHLTAHSWPEEGYVAVDLFTCSADTDEASVRRALEAAFDPQRVEARRVARDERARR